MCASRRRKTTHEPKREWKQETYTCSKCKKTHPPTYYNYRNLATLEEKQQTYLAVCIPCEKNTNATKLITCVGCNNTKQKDEFSFSRQRCKNYSTWRCLECDFPPCQMCQAKPRTPQKNIYMRKMLVSAVQTRCATTEKYKISQLQ